MTDHRAVIRHLEANPLLAKWREDKEDFRPARGFFWPTHNREVLWGLDLLFSEPFHGRKSYPSLAHALHDLMALEPAFEDFQRWSFLAALGHDLGKCSGEFQQMMVGMELHYLAARGPLHGLQNDEEACKAMRVHMDGLRRHRQAYRHEFLSALLMFHHPEIRAWFRTAAGSDEGLAYAIAGAFGHHIKGHERKAFRSDPDLLIKRGFGELPVWTDKLSVDMNTLLQKHLPPGAPTLSAFPTLARLAPGNRICRYAELTDRLNEMRADPLFYNLGDDKTSMAIKWLVILADVLGSMTTKSQRPTREVILEAIQSLWSSRRVDYHARIQQRLESIGPEAKLYPWQRKCRTRHKNLILTSSTGQGKSLGVLSWASGDPDSTLIFCSATTDASTLLYEDYGSRDLAAQRDGLRHSKAWYDLRYRTTHESNDARKGKSEDQQEQEEGQEIMDLLKHSDRDVLYTTTDQVLGLLAFYRKSIGLLPLLLRSQIAFDEVSSYDTQMLALHSEFLDLFPGVRTAHLSATLPQTMEDRLAGQLERENPASPTNTRPRVLHDSRRWGSSRMTKRFRLHLIQGVPEASQLFDPGTLWILNVVRRAQELGQMCPDALVYHSRFKYEDRQRIRSDLVTNYQSGAPTLRAISTQVAEMSLDISAKRLITEVCPIASFIQRCGRVNRQGEHGIVDVYAYVPEQDNGLPYVASNKPEIWETTYDRWAQWIQQFGGAPVCQDDLENAFQEFYARPENRVLDREAFRPRLQTYRHSVRYAIYTVPALLDVDVAPFLAKGKEMTGEEMIRKSLPVMLTPSERKALMDAKSIHRRQYVIGPQHGHYDARLGFLATPNGSWLIRSE